MSKTKLLKDELIKIKAQFDVLEESKRELEKKLKDEHPNQPGRAVLIRRTPHTLSMLYVSYKEGIPEVTESFTRDPVLSDDKSEFVRWSPAWVKPEEVTWLEPLSEEEMERLQELNEMDDFSCVDSRSEARELETERDKLRERCGHKWKDTSPMFSQLARQHCEKCCWEMRNDD